MMAQNARKKAAAREAAVFVLWRLRNFGVCVILYL